MRKTQSNLILLNMVFVMGLVMSNLFGGKLIQLLGFTVAGAVVTYPLTFLTTDIIGELWGKEAANQCVKVGIIAQAVFLVLGYLSLAIPPLEASTELQHSLRLVLNQGSRMTLASLGAFSVSQFMDVSLFHRMKALCKGKQKWIRNNLSTMTSQFFDTVIFILIAFYGVVPDIWGMVIGQYLIKLILAACDTPFFYFFTRKRANPVKQ